MVILDLFPRGSQVTCYVQGAFLGLQIAQDRPLPAYRGFGTCKEGSPTSLEVAEGSGRASQRRGDRSQILRVSRQGRKGGDAAEGTAPAQVTEHERV